MPGVPKLLCIPLLVLLQPGDCQTQVTTSATSHVTVPSAQPIMDTSQMRWDPTSWPFGAPRDEKFVAVQLAADRLKPKGQAHSPRRQKVSVRSFPAAPCQPGNAIEFDFLHAALVANNLGGKGPKAGEENAIRFAKLARRGDDWVDLEIRVSPGETYNPVKTEKNGFSKEHLYGQINVKTGSSVDLTFTLLKSGTDERVTLDDFYLSFLDLDQGLENAATESITISDHAFEKYYVSEETELSISQSGGLTRIASTKYGTSADNPTDPLKLTPLQASRTATFLFRKTDQVRMTLGAGDSPDGHGRNFFFAGKASEPCATTTTTTSKPGSARRRRRSATRRRRKPRAPGSARRRRRGPKMQRRRRNKPSVPPTTTTPAPTPLPTSPPHPEECPAIRANSVPNPSCKCQEMCLIFGDPHFVRFDGTFVMSPHLAPLHYFWAVNSATVKIQGHATGNTKHANGDWQSSWVGGLAVGGSFLQGHTLVASMNGPRSIESGIVVKWDGQEVLKTARRFSPPDLSGVQFIRDTGKNHLPPDAVLKKVFRNLYYKKWVQKWKNADVYSFKLPANVEIFIIRSGGNNLHSIQAVVRMPPQGDNAGWCGNFNGEKGDEPKGRGHIDYDRDDDPGRNFPGYFVEPSENLFKQAGLALVEVPQDYSATGVCSGEAFSRAARACSHISEAGIRDACIEDICASGRVEIAQAAADDIAVIKGIQEGVGAMKECEPI